MMRFVHQRVRVQPRIVHHTFDQIIHNACDAVNAAQALVEGLLLLNLVLTALLCHIVLSGCCFRFGGTSTWPNALKRSHGSAQRKWQLLAISTFAFPLSTSVCIASLAFMPELAH